MWPSVSISAHYKAGLDRTRGIWCSQLMGAELGFRLWPGSLKQARSGHPPHSRRAPFHQVLPTTAGQPGQLSDQDCFWHRELSCQSFFTVGADALLSRKGKGFIAQKQ